MERVPTALSIVQEARAFLRSAERDTQRGGRVAREVPLDLCRSTSSLATVCTATSSSFSASRTVSSLSFGSSLEPLWRAKEDERKSKKARESGFSRQCSREDEEGILATSKSRPGEGDDLEVTAGSVQLQAALARLKQLAQNKRGRRRKPEDRKKASQLETRSEASGHVVKGQCFTWVRGELLGRGSLGSVWKATEQRSGLTLAVKEVIIDGLEDEKDFSQSLQGEIDLYKQLKHPNIVSYLGNDRIRDRFYIYLEYMQGGSVSQVLARLGPMAEPQISGYARQLLEGLDYLHTREPLILHRDIKGGNILVGERRIVKLADFGCSKRSEETCKHTLRGSIPWMAPEVMNERAYGRKADMWSLGCVFIEMVTAEPPWGPMRNPLATMVRVATSEETPPVTVPISDSFRDLITICTRRDPEERLLCSELTSHPFLELAALET